MATEKSTEKETKTTAVKKPATAPKAVAEKATAPKAPAKATAKPAVKTEAPKATAEKASTKPVSKPVAKEPKVKAEKVKGALPYVSNGQITVELVKSTNGVIIRQKRTVMALGLSKIGDKATHKDNPAIRGMVNQVAHLVKVEKI